MVKGMTLIVVESPTKARTLSRFLGSDYNVMATYGHVRDLTQRKLGVDIKNNFEPLYVMVTKQKDRVKELEDAAAKADTVLLATDPDREGEAIAWHVAALINPKSQITSSIRRIVFHEITQRAIEDAIKNPRDIDIKLVEAQQARRVLDRLVGYKLSPLLWQKVRKGLSAGRVQSVALRLVVEREREIEAFKPEEYWNIWVTLKNIQELTIKTQLVEKNGEKLTIGNQVLAEQVEEDLRGAEYAVAGLEKKEIKKTPPPPFTTSTLQQAAANKLGWSAKKTMQVAQMLYEEGNITYHRTDSTNIATEAVKDASLLIASLFGKEYALDIPRFYKTKSKVAQEAHEAIRPTNVNYQLSIDSSQLINKDQVKLYELVWKRFVACQMAEARGVSVRVGISGKKDQVVYGLEARGETINFEGWLKVYGLKYQNGENGEDHPEGVLPELNEGEGLTLVQIVKEQKFTQPPARYNDASLIKALEERGIGRPSTYAPTLSTIQDRQYVERMEKRFKPTALGVAVNDFLVTNFSKIVDYDFTAKMEDDLDEIAGGEKQWRPVISDFYEPFEKEVVRVGQEVGRVKIEVESTGQSCPECNQGEVIVRLGRFGKFLACSRYPECGYKANYMEKIGMPCPVCGGDIIVRHTRSRKSFYGCSNYPNCKYASWTKPQAKPKEG
jgi:DNA topoisomerase-1